MTDRLTTLQETIEKFLSARPFFHGSGTQKEIPVLTERIGDIDSAIAEAVGKIGACVVVTTPEGTNTQPNAPVAVIKPTVVCTVHEDVTINRSATGSRQPASKIADAVAFYLHQSVDLGDWLIFQEKALNRQNPDGLAYDVIFEGAEMSLTEPTR